VKIAVFDEILSKDILCFSENSVAVPPKEITREQLQGGLKSPIVFDPFPGRREQREQLGNNGNNGLCFCTKILATGVSNNFHF
jgi:hypothetical protein